MESLNRRSVSGCFDVDFAELGRNLLVVQCDVSKREFVL